jgi:hypothetical protein
MKNKQIFPIKTETGCLLKWAWSTVYLGQGTTSSCHRTDQIPIPPDDFVSFHNLPEKVQARQMMLNGEWPGAGCEYCQKIEMAGGMSDRQYQLFAEHDQDRTPAELVDNPRAVEVVPTILEIYFNNTCNMSCLYCGPKFSSKWVEENRKFGVFQKGAVKFGHAISENYHYEKMLAGLWQYLEKNYSKIRYFQILGGEPFFQKEFVDCVNFWEQHPNPELTFNIISNLKVPHNRFCEQIDQFERMIDNGQLKRLQITGSLDAWGPQQEYTRHGLDLNEWSNNFEYLLDKPWIITTINSAINALSIKTTPELINRMNDWNTRAVNRINYSFMTVTTPPMMRPDIFGPGMFDQDFENILSAMSEQTPEDQSAKEHMRGIARQVTTSQKQSTVIEDLRVYLTEIDQRRGTNWPELFPWLVDLN